MSCLDSVVDPLLMKVGVWEVHSLSSPCVVLRLCSICPSAAFIAPNDISPTSLAGKAKRQSFQVALSPLHNIQPSLLRDILGQAALKDRDKKGTARSG